VTGDLTDECTTLHETKRSLESGSSLSIAEERAQFVPPLTCTSASLDESSLAATAVDSGKLSQAATILVSRNFLYIAQLLFVLAYASLSPRTAKVTLH